VQNLRRTIKGAVGGDGKNSADDEVPSATVAHTKVVSGKKQSIGRLSTSGLFSGVE
jgi:hypothetical protein